MSACHFCNRPHPVDPIPQGALTIDGVQVAACFRCWAAHDDEDQARTFAMMAAPVFAPEVVGPPRVVAPRPVVIRRRTVEDLTGARFGRLLVLGPALKDHIGGPRLAWRVRCDCGAEAVMTTFSLQRGARACRPCGQRSGPRERAFCKLSPSRAEQVRIARARGWTLRQIGKRFGISPATACNVVNGKAWRLAA